MANLKMNILVLSLCLLNTAIADSFLKAQSPSALVSREEVEAALFAELFSAEKAGRVKEIEVELKSMYAALPKSELGTLDSSTVRYALHRYFVHKHGWYMKGIDPSGSSFNSSSATIFLKDKAPAFIQSIFEERMNRNGLGLHELAVFAATLEDLVHKEANIGLAEAFTALHLPLYGDVGAKWADMASKAYFMTYILEGSYPVDMAEFQQTEKAIPEIYPGWEDTHMWMHDMKKTLAFIGSARNPFDDTEGFHEVSRFVEELAHRFGSFQNIECHTLKDKLLDMEHDGSGRVRLSRFYQGASKGDWTFAESEEYLRNLGVLDETDPARPSVVIPNYLTSATNCLSSSGFYSVCCSDLCEGLMAHIESEISGPAAAADQIAGVVSELSSDTVDAPRNLSTQLVDRLHQIAALHGGMVPVHGRLFSQWLHHAYPRECVFPHISGTVDPISPWEFMERHGEEALDATEAQIKLHLKSADIANAATSAIPWSDVEELVSLKSRRHSRRREQGSIVSLRNFMAVVALVSFALPLVRTSKVVLKDHSQKSAGHLV